MGEKYEVPAKDIQRVDDNVKHENVLLYDGKSVPLGEMDGSYFLEGSTMNISQMAYLVVTGRLVSSVESPESSLISITVKK